MNNIQSKIKRNKLSKSNEIKHEEENIKKKPNQIKKL